jgi:membrane protease YdiL (CAAX protease family)
VALALFLAVACPAVVILALILAHRWSADVLKFAQDPSHPVAFFTINGVLFFVLAAAFAAAIRLVHAKRFAEVLGAWRWRDFAVGFALWAATLVCLTLVDFVVAPAGFHISVSGQTAALALAAAIALAVQTFAEEFIFRGYLTQGLLLATRRTAPTAVLSGLLFGAAHIPNGGPQAASATIFGIVFAVLAIRTGSIAFGYGLHFMNNLFGAVVVASGSDVFHGSPALFTQTTPQLMWWDTAVGAVALVAVACGFLRRRLTEASCTPARP